MKEFAPDKIRNVALVGHQDTGKTTLAEAILHTTGVVGRMGKIQDGNTAMDTAPEEIERQISIQAALAFCEFQGHKINLIDTPGYEDFVGEVLSKPVGVNKLAQFQQHTTAEINAVLRPKCKRHISRRAGQYVEQIIDRRKRQLIATVRERRNVFGGQTLFPPQQLGICPIEVFQTTSRHQTLQRHPSEALPQKTQQLHLVV